MTTVGDPRDRPSLRRLRELLRNMLDIYSPSGKETELVDYLRGVLKRRGLEVVDQAVDEERDNLLVLPSAGRANLAFVGHVDTVTAYDLDAYAFREAEGLVYGLGAADMKGGCAAMIEAFCALRAAHGPELPIALCLLVGEEETQDGAIRLIEDLDCPWAIIGEPTELRPCFSNFGYVELLLQIAGQRRHASLASRGQHPIEKLLKIALGFLVYVETNFPEVVFNLRDLRSSQCGFAVPEQAEVGFDLHLPPGTPLGKVLQDSEDALHELFTEHGATEASLRFPTIDSGYELPSRGAIFDALNATYEALELRFEPDSFRSHSDANVLWESGVRPILLGPGSLEQAHAPEEHVRLADVEKACRIYFELGQRLRDS
jgi:acetylornithine deacetylase